MRARTPATRSRAAGATYRACRWRATSTTAATVSVSGLRADDGQGRRPRRRQCGACCDSTPAAEGCAILLVAPDRSPRRPSHPRGRASTTCCGDAGRARVSSCTSARSIGGESASTRACRGFRPDDARLAPLADRTGESAHPPLPLTLGRDGAASSRSAPRRPAPRWRAPAPPATPRACPRRRWRSSQWRRGRCTLPTPVFADGTVAVCGTPHELREAAADGARYLRHPAPSTHHPPPTPHPRHRRRAGGCRRVDRKGPPSMLRSLALAPACARPFSNRLDAPVNRPADAGRDLFGHASRAHPRSRSSPVADPAGQPKGKATRAPAVRTRGRLPAPSPRAVDVDQVVRGWCS